MNTFKAAMLTITLALAAALAADPPNTGPETDKAPTTGEAPTTATAPAADPAAVKILDRLEKAGEKFPRIAADVDCHVDMRQVGDSETRTGQVWYQAPAGEEAGKFRIHFETLKAGDKGAKSRERVDYAFDGQWLTVRKEKIKQWIRYQVKPPGEKANPLELGQGPFPVPFGQKTAAVLEKYSPTTRPPAKDDPKDTEYIKLTTRPTAKDLNMVWIEMWVRPDGLPVKIVTEDRSENRTTAVFDNIKTPDKFDASIFDLPRPPPGSGWEVRIETFKGKVE